ncbi:glycosyltransferase [Vibrio variabilis]|uniref:glycosyltransferase n=1 Tax=Vibrio variabilis TaxID=990271 RepID=UPI00068ADFFD|nr:glycosyltransferase [Vibrio variabilis]
MDNELSNDAERPKVSVYITTFNRLKLLKRAIVSVQSQTYKNIEIIVSDDGSSDGTIEYLTKLNSMGTIKAIINDSAEPKGACHGRNKAIEMSSGLFITGLDDDDYFSPSRISEFVSYWDSLSDTDRNSTVGLFDNIIEIKGGEFNMKDSIAEATTFDLRRANVIGNQIFAKKEAFLNAGLFDVSMPAWQDWDMWLRMSELGGMFRNIRKGTYQMDLSHEGERISTSKSNRIRQAYYKFCVKASPLTKHERTSIIEQLYTYHQTKPRFNELLCLISAGKIRPIARSIRALILKR